MSKALVLSGGGAVGIAWQTGLACGLAEQGVDLSKASCVIGTSAGSAVGAQIALGHDLRAAMERFVRPAASGASPPQSDGSAPASPPRAAARGSQQRLQDLFALMANAMAPDADPKQARAALGRFALEAQTIDEERFVKGFAYLAGERWPRAFSCTAVDVHSGDFMVWNETSSVDLVAAVASSCAVPGLFPPITIGGRRYMDGGMRSGTNADLAKGHERVLIVTLLGRFAADTGPSASTDGAMARRIDRMQRNAERELSVLRESGSSIEQIGPDAEAAERMGMDLMNPSLVYDASQAGLRQGRATAQRLREFWR
jgi:NTE family protein